MLNDQGIKAKGESNVKCFSSDLFVLVVSPGRDGEGPHH